MRTKIKKNMFARNLNYENYRWRCVNEINIFKTLNSRRKNVSMHKKKMY